MAELSAKEYLFAVLDRNKRQLKGEKPIVVNSKVAVFNIENFMGAIPNYISREDLTTSNKMGMMDKVSSGITYIQAKLDMRASKEEKKACTLSLERALNADISEIGHKQYRMRRLNEILKEFETIISLDELDENNIRKLYFKALELEKHLSKLGIDDASYASCIDYINNIRNNLAQKLFNLRLEEVKRYQKQKTRKN